ncbi:MAG: cytochrome c oxidase assembly protein [Actinomycetales bacterium]|nr:cytochrome c oxidase assembly protein [Actinomycetales bacterium]
MWFPNPLRDQQLSGDLLWAIAEVVDIPVLALLFITWRRSDKRDAKAIDKLTDEQMDELMKAHLRGSYTSGS